MKISTQKNTYLQDVTNHPTWTGEEAGLNLEDQRMARFLAKYEGYNVRGDRGPGGGGDGGAAGQQQQPKKKS